MAAQQSQGISTLLEAEKEAAKIVSRARACTSGAPTHPSPGRAIDWLQRLRVPIADLVSAFPHFCRPDAKAEGRPDGSSQRN